MPSSEIATRMTTKMVIIPARNEAPTVGAVVETVYNRLDWEVVVVDDASEDNTSREAGRYGATVLRLPYRLGSWGAIQTGMQYALEHGSDMVLTMDADGQHLTTSLEAVAQPVVMGRFDVSIGICPQRVSTARKLAWGVFRSITGLNVRDVTSGLRAYNIHAIRALTGRDATMLNYQDVGVLLMLRDAGLMATEVMVPMNTRKYGKSKVYDSWGTVALYLLETLALSVAHGRRPWRNGRTLVTTPVRDAG